MATGIYTITNQISGRVYVGQAVDVARRWKTHLRAMRSGVKTKLYDAMRAYGVQSFVQDVLEECAADELAEREAYWIAKLDTLASGYNMIADTAQRRLLSDETRERMRQAQIGKKHTNEHRAAIARAGRGRVVTAETRAKLSAALSGKKRSPEAIERMHEAARKRDNSHLINFAFRPGCKLSEETRAAMSSARRGVPKSPEHREKLKLALAKARAVRWSTEVKDSY